MADKKLIQETIIELLDANIDKETIYSTLKEIGVGEEEIDDNYEEIINQRKNPETSSQTPETTEKEESQSIEEEPKEEEKSEEMPKSTTKTNFLEENKKRDQDRLEEDLKETTSDVDKINTDDIFNTSKKEEPVKKNNNNNLQLQDIEEQVRELKAQMTALTKIMKDILEENRNILNKIK